MSRFRDSAAKTREQLITHSSNSFIPKLDNDDPFSYVASFFQKLICRNYQIKKVSIIDPYFTTLDVDFVASLFGGHGLSVEIISKYNSACKSDDENGSNKSVRISSIKKSSEYLIKNGIFKKIFLIKTTCKMHDRYFIFWDNQNVCYIFSIGGSLGQKFSEYIGVNELTNKNMIYDVLRYYDVLCLDAEVCN